MSLRLCAFAVICVAAAVVAAPTFHETFESGVGGSYTWTPWPPAAPGGINNLFATSTDHNHTVGGLQSARVFASDPAAWNGYADFGAYGGSLRADCYLFEDFSNDGTNAAQPVTNMFSLYGNGAGPDSFTDYIQLGVVPFYPGGSARYGFRTRYNDSTGAGIINTGIARKAGWTHLAIQVDALSLGGEVRFYIDDALVGTSRRAGANGGAGGLGAVDLRWVRIGNNSKSYENFWYDDVNVTPEPAAACLVLGGVSLLSLRRVCRSHRR